MELKKELVGEYTGSIAPSVRGKTLVVRNRRKIYESEKGHLLFSEDFNSCFLVFNRKAREKFSFV